MAIAAATCTLVEVLLAAAWLQDKTRDWAEPLLVIVGLLIPLLGIPPLHELFAASNEEDAAAELVTYLENRGLLYEAYPYEHPDDCHFSAKEMRADITKIMQRMPRAADVFAEATSMRRELAAFMRGLERHGIERKHYERDLSDAQNKAFRSLIDDLRKNIAAPLFRVVQKYRLKVHGDLNNIFAQATANQPVSATEADYIPEV